MNCSQAERLTREHHLATNRLKDQTTLIDCLRNDLETQKQLNNKLRIEIQESRSQVRRLKGKIQQQKIDRESVQSRYTLVLRKMEQQVQNYKKRCAKIENKIIPLMDTDSVRLKILNEVETNHRLQLQNSNNKVRDLKQEVLKYKREVQILKHALESERTQHSQQLRRTSSNRINEGTQETINYLSGQMFRQVQARLRKSYQDARKQAEFYKEKYFACQKKYQQRMNEIEANI